MNLIYIVFGLGFSGFGILFAFGKIHTHIAAWKAMSEEEKDAVRIGPLCRNIGEVIALCGIIFLINGLVPGMGKHTLTVAMIAWLIVAGLDLLWMEKSRRYRRNGASDREMLPDRSVRRAPGEAGRKDR